jgi:hypothetical protein
MASTASTLGAANKKPSKKKLPNDIEGGMKAEPILLSASSIFLKARRGLAQPLGRNTILDKVIQVKSISSRATPKTTEYYVCMEDL